MVPRLCGGLQARADFEIRSHTHARLQLVTLLLTLVLALLLGGCVRPLCVVAGAGGFRYRGAGHYY